MNTRLTPRDYSAETIALAEERQRSAFDSLRRNGESLEETIERFTPRIGIDDLEDVSTWSVNSRIAKVRFSRYENAERYPIYQTLFQIAIAQILARDDEPDTWPMLVTLPSGNLDAYTERDPIEECELVFIERGILDYIVNASRVVNWLLPEGPVTMIKGQHTTSMQSTAALQSLLMTYVVDGTPDLDAGMLPIQDIGTVPVRKLLAPRAMAFLLMHELAHILFGHTKREPEDDAEAKNREFQCDLEAFRAVVSASHDDEKEWGMPMFVADSFLCALHAFIIALARLWRGDWQPVWQSTTHPSPMERRRYLRDSLRSMLPAREAAIGEQIYDMNTSVWGNSVHMVQLLMEQGLLEHPQEPHPLWHAYARSCFGPRKNQAA